MVEDSNNKDRQDAYKFLSDEEVPLTLEEIKHLYKDGKILMQISMDDLNRIIVDIDSNKIKSGRPWNEKKYLNYFIAMDNSGIQIKGAGANLIKVDEDKIDDTNLFRLARDKMIEQNSLNDSSITKQIKHYTVLVDRDIIPPEMFEEWKSAIEQYPDSYFRDLRDASGLLKNINNGEITDEEIADNMYPWYGPSYNPKYTVNTHLIKLMFRFANNPQELCERLKIVGESLRIYKLEEHLNGIYDEASKTRTQKTYKADDFLEASATQGNSQEVRDILRAIEKADKEKAGEEKHSGD